MAFGGCSGARWWLVAAGFAMACTGAAAQDQNSPAVPVEAAKVVAAPLSEQVTAIGTLLSDEAVTVSSEIPGRLKEIHFQEGQPIEQGALLFTLDDSVYQAQLADAEAKLKLAEQTNKRTAQLFSNKYATAQSADEFDLERGGEHCRRRARPGAAREGAYRWRRSRGLSGCVMSASASTSPPVRLWSISRRSIR